MLKIDITPRLFNVIFMIMIITLTSITWYGCNKEAPVEPNVDQNAGPTEIDYIEVQPSSGEFSEIGQTIQFTAVAVDVDTNIISDIKFSWSSSNTSVVQVNSEGLATAISGGTAVISASSQGYSGKANVNVMQGNPLGMTLKRGDFWEYLWNWESENYAQGSGTDFETENGIFTVTLQSAVTIAGLEAFPISVSGPTSDGNFDFSPEWTHLAVGSDGSLLGSKDGNTLQVLYNSKNSSWNGGGYFLPIPDDQQMQSYDGQFTGAYNQIPALVVSRHISEGGCTYYPSVGQTICSGDPLSITEREYYKEGVGPIGYSFESNISYSGGGFFTSHKNTRTVELINTSLFPTDGSIFHRPPWENVAPLNISRYQHSCTVLNGEIYAIGGHNGSNSLSSIEIYDPGSNSWRFGTSLPKALLYHEAEIVDGKIYVIPSYDNPIYIYNPMSNSWTTGENVPYDDPAHGICSMDNDYVVSVTPNGAFSGGLYVFIYQVSQNKWLNGFSVSLDDHRWFTVSAIQNDLYVIGGYRQSMDSKVSKFIHFYDAALGTWEKFFASLNKARYSHASVKFNGEIISLGGTDGTASLRDMEAFSPQSKTSRVLPSMLRHRKDFDAVTLNGKIYVIGGNDGSKILNNVEVYTP